MKHLLIFIILFMAQSVYSQVFHTRHGMSGMVKSVIVKYYDPSDLENHERISTEEYNRNGLVISNNGYSHKYDSCGNLVERNGSDSKTLYRYDHSNNLLYRISYRDNKITGSTIYAYDEDGNNTQKIEYNSSGDIHWKFTYEYNDDGTLRSESEISGSDLRLYKMSQKIKSYVYDDNGNVIKEYRGDPSNKRKTEKNYTYNYKGQLIATETNSTGWSTHRETFKYNSKGYLIEETSDFEDNWTYKYKYDKQGNYIKKRSFQNGTEHIVITREITYYN